MAADSQDFDATGVPRALEDELSLTAGLRYTISNSGETLARLRIGATQPAADARGHPLRPYGSGVVRPETGVKHWLWSLDPDGAELIVSEVA